MDLVDTELTEPLSSVLYQSLHGFKFLNFTTEEDAAIKAGHLVYLTAATYANGITRAPANYGSTAEQSTIYMTVEHPSTQYLNPGNFNLDDAYATGSSVRGIELQPGDRVWARGSSLTAAADEILIPAANGLLTNVGDPDGAAIDAVAHAFKCLKAVSSGSWVLVEYLGRQVFDATA